MSRAADRVTAAAMRLAWGSVRRVPDRVAFAAFDVAADVAWRRDTADAQALRANYARARPELGGLALDALVRDGLRAYLRYWCEVFRLPGRSPDDIRTAVRVEGDELVRAQFAAGHAVVGFLGHLGNWDLAGAWSGLELAPVTTVAERLEPAQLFDAFLSFRRTLGMTVLPLDPGPGVFGRLREATREPRLVPLLADRDLTGNGVDVTFCGRPARMAPGPAALAVSTRTALHPVTVRHEALRDRGTGRGGHGIVITFHPRVPDPGTGSARERVVVMTQGCADVLGEVVRAHTADWHMMQPVFVGGPDRLTRRPRGLG